MSKQAWGNATWFMMHTLAQKLRPEYSHGAVLLVRHFQNICRNLPCPDCAEHAGRMFAQANLSAVKDKDSLVRFLWEFHSIVNQRLGKRSLTLEQCQEYYERGNTVAILKHFFAVLRSIRSQDKAMIHGFRRQQCLTTFASFIDGHMHLFSG